MDSIYDKYRYESENLQNNKKEMIEFFKLMTLFMKLDYDGRINVMKETWGEQKDLPKTYYYGDFCNVKIFMEDDKFRFQFNCENGDIEEFRKINPEFVEEMLKGAEEKLKQVRPELFYETDAKEEQQATSEFQEVSDYIAMYNKMNLKKD